MNPYDRGSAFGKCLTLTCERPNLVWFWTLHSDTGSLFPFLCCKKIIVLHFVFLLQLLVQMVCAVRAESSKSGMAVVPPKQSQKVRGHLFVFCFFPKPNDSWEDLLCLFFSREVLLWSSLSWSRAVQGGLVHCPGIAGLGYVFVWPHYTDLFVITSVIIMFGILFLGTDKYGFGFGGTGKKSHNKQFDSYGEVRDDEGIWFDSSFGRLTWFMPFPGVHYARHHRMLHRSG